MIYLTHSNPLIRYLLEGVWPSSELLQDLLDGYHPEVVETESPGDDGE